MYELNGHNDTLIYSEWPLERGRLVLILQGIDVYQRQYGPLVRFHTMTFDPNRRLSLNEEARKTQDKLLECIILKDDDAPCERHLSLKAEMFVQYVSSH